MNYWKVYFLIINSYDTQRCEIRVLSEEPDRVIRRTSEHLYSKEFTLIPLHMWKISELQYDRERKYNGDNWTTIKLKKKDYSKFTKGGE